MSLISRVLLLAALSIPSAGFSQEYIASVVGSLSGTVEDDQGNMVAPQGAVHATMTASLVGNDVIAEISGTGACTGGLGLSIEFEAQYDVASGSFSGLYSDIPGMTPDQPIEFVHNGGTSWSALLSGEAPSPTGGRAYDLTYTFEVPDTAIVEGALLPPERTYSGNLYTIQTAEVPIDVPDANLNTTLNANIEFNGSWEANAVPQPDQSLVFTGSVSGTFQSTETQTVSTTIPGIGNFSVDVFIDGSFGGSLFLVDQNTVVFNGSWVANSVDQTLGGDISITISTEATNLPFAVSGTVPIETGFTSLPQVDIPFSISGAFPLEIN